jgi:hypothetical protein
MVLSSVSSTLGDLIVFNSSPAFTVIDTQHHASIPFFLSDASAAPGKLLPIYLPRLALLCVGEDVD